MTFLFILQYRIQVHHEQDCITCAELAGEIYVIDLLGYLSGTCNRITLKPVHSSFY